MTSFRRLGPQRRFLISLGGVAVLVAVVGAIFYESPVGLEQFCPAGILAGAGWLVSGLFLRKKSVLLAVYAVGMLVAVVGALPLLLVAWFTVNPMAGDHFVIANRQISDDRLVSVIKPNAWGHDANGYRNRRVPDHADLVAFGDSQTWGINATREEAWPYVLADRMDQSVYSMASVGFGTVEYWVLLGDVLVARTPDLSPDTVIVGFYFGNDLYDAYESIYQYPPYAAYRDPSAGPELFDNRIAPLADAIGIEQADGAYKGGGVNTQFTAEYRSLALDLDDPRITEGLRISSVLLTEMDASARAAGVRFVVLLIPTKERVYADLMAGATNPTYWALIDYEQRAHAALVAALDAEGIVTVDALPALQAAVAQGDAVYRDATDGHPTARGYRVIADVLYEALQAE